MKEAKSFRKVALFTLTAAVFVGFVAAGISYTARDLYPFFMSRPSVNAAIAVLGLLGLTISFTRLAGFLRQSRVLDRLSKLAKDHSPAGIERMLERLDGGIVRDRIQRSVDLAAKDRLDMEAIGFMSDADLGEQEAKGAFVRYVLGVMVFLGLIGTFWGVLITVRGVQQVLEALEPARVADPVSFVTQLKTSMGGMLAGLSTAFSTSLFGLAGSVVLGFVDLQVRKAASVLTTDLDRQMVTMIAPALYSAPREHVLEARPVESPADALYHVASQETLGQHLRDLADVFCQRSDMDDKITSAIVEMKSLLEISHEERVVEKESSQKADTARQGLLERMDNLNRNVERMIREAKLSREASDSVTKALVERLKLEGEITNKTLSLGFSDLSRRLETVASRPTTRPEE